MNYELEKIYDFKVTRISGSRIFLEDEDGSQFFVHGYDFQTEWDAASPQVPMKLKCYVHDIEESGDLKLYQSRLDTLKALYPAACLEQPKESLFVISRLRQTEAGELLFVVSDAYGLTHLYKPTDEQKSMQPGDEIKLTVIKILEKDHNRSSLLFKRNRDDGTVTTPIAQVVGTADETGEETHVGEFGEEGPKREFKSTIVYPASATGADIDTQIQVIVKTVAGFMNADGGTLFIGVNDCGDAVGIEAEYALLNSSAKDKKQYKENTDGYETKIRCAIKYYLSAVAIDYIKISFSKHGIHTVCTIEVNPSNSIIWFKECEAYKRLGNSTSHLRSTLIEKLVIDKHSMYPAMYPVKPTLVKDEDTAQQNETEEYDNIVDDTTGEKLATPATIQKIGDKRKGKGSFYMNMFSDGKWSWSKDMPTDEDLEFCIPINSPASKRSLMMVYEDGCVNKVDAYHLHSERSVEGRRYANGRRNDGVKLVKAFAAQEDDLLACFCIQNGHEFVKVHPVKHVTTHDTMSLKGNILINKTFPGVTDASINFVDAQHSQRVSALTKTENQTANSLGWQMDVSRYANLIRVRDTLRSVCDVVADGNNN